MNSLDDVLTIGITNGCVYAIVGVGFVLVYRASRVVSFAQGGFMVLGSLLFAALLRAGSGLVLSMLGAALAMAALSGVLFLLTLRRLVGGNAFVTSVCTVGLGTIMAGVGVLIWGASTIVIPSQFSYRRIGLILGMTVNPAQVFTVVTTAIIFCALVILMRSTPIGLRMRAVASNPVLAAYTGVSVGRISTYAWALGGLTGGIAGIVFLLSSPSDPGSIFTLGLAALPAIILGGLDSIPGSLVGGILIGLAQAAIAQYSGASYEVVGAYGVLLIVLLVRPQGLFGSAEVVRL